MPASILQAGLTLQDLSCLREDDLSRMGVSAMGMRKRILAAASSLHHPAKQNLGSEPKGTHLAPLAAASQQGSAITSFFRSHQVLTKRACITDFFPAQAGEKGEKPPKSSKCSRPQAVQLGGKENQPGKSSSGSRLILNFLWDLP